MGNKGKSRHECRRSRDWNQGRFRQWRKTNIGEAGDIMTTRHKLTLMLSLRRPKSP